MSRSEPQLRIQRNDWSPLRPSPLGQWTPTLSVTVVIPAFNPLHLDAVLAGLARQTYPGHLLEVVVADDGSTPPVRLPDLVPERTRVVPVTESWGRAAACEAGARASDGHVVHFLDADMLPERTEVEAQLRWHHLVDYAVVLGNKLFVDPGPVAGLSPGDVAAAVDRGTLRDLFSDPQPHDWVQAWIDETAGLTTAGPRACRVFVGASGSMTRDLYDEAGGMNTSLKLGEDSELGYRLGEVGGVFVPDAEALSWHLGHSHVMADAAAVNSYNDAFLVDLIPEQRGKRRRVPRRYTVPFLEVVVDTAGQSYDGLVHLTDALLASEVPDAELTVLGPWASLADERRSPLADPLRELRMFQAAYRAEPRVLLAERLPETRCRAMFRLSLSSTAAVPGAGGALSRTLEQMDHSLEGVWQLELPGGHPALLVRTAALARATRLRAPGEDATALAGRLFGARTVSGAETGFVPAADRQLRRMPGNVGSVRPRAGLPARRP